MCQHCVLNNKPLRLEFATRAFRLITVYKHLMEAYDWMVFEAESQQDFARKAGKDTFVANEELFNQTKAVLTTIGDERDYIAAIIALLCGENRFKTGQVHVSYDAVMKALDNDDDEALCDALEGLLDLSTAGGTDAEW